MKQTINVCMIGAGRVGKLHSGTIKQYAPNAEITALVDPAAAILNETGDQFEIDGRYPSLEEALEKADFEVVIITTPTFTHLQLAELAASEGKHVFLEKPMAMNLQECDAIMAATEEKGLILQLGFMRRFDPEFVAAAERIFGGEIGEPTLVKSLTHGPGLPPPWANDIRTSNGMIAERRPNISMTICSPRSNSNRAHWVISPACALAIMAMTRGWRSSARKASCRSARCRAWMSWSVSTGTRG
jgi:myo-inositol 2-dehydrogenase/D-chiro-inositol 1-dehydrogenase/scyllo-inositol 2-dehydrogenase (NAD+)